VSGPKGRGVGGLKGRIAVLVLLVFAVVAVVALVAVNVRFEVITASPSISHEAIAPVGTRARLIMSPPLARDFITNRYHVTTPIALVNRFVERFDLTETIFDAVVPREVAILFTPDIRAAKIRTTVFVNDRRMSPLIARASERIGLADEIPYVEWDSAGLEPHGRGFLSMSGTMEILPEANTIVQQKWGRPPLTLSMLPSSGGHLIEVILDNRDGSSCAILISLLAANGASTERLTKPDVMDVMVHVSQGYITADLTESGELGIHVDVEIRESTSDMLFEGFRNSFELVMDEIRVHLPTDMTGSHAVEGNHLVADYTIADPATLFGLDTDSAR